MALHHDNQYLIESGECLDLLVVVKQQPLLVSFDEHQHMTLSVAADILETVDNITFGLVFE